MGYACGRMAETGAGERLRSAISSRGDCSRARSTCQRLGVAVALDRFTAPNDWAQRDIRSSLFETIQPGNGSVTSFRMTGLCVGMRAHAEEIFRERTEPHGSASRVALFVASGVAIRALRWIPCSGRSSRRPRSARAASSPSEGRCRPSCRCTGSTAHRRS